MFTVIIAEKKMIELISAREVFLKPLLNEDIVFCEWRSEGNSIDEMLPGIYETVKYRKQWRAIVVYPDGLEKVNPFDYTEYRDTAVEVRKSVPWEKLAQRRQKRCAVYEAACENPLMRLTSALCPKTTLQYLIEDDEVFGCLMRDEMPLYGYMLRAQMRDVHPSAAAERLKEFQYDQVLRFVDEEQAPALIEAVRTADPEAILAMIDPEDIIAFISLLGGGDLLHTDPEYNECLVENTCKARLTEKMQKQYVFRDALPEEVICVAARTFAGEEVDPAKIWSGPDESDYSRFAEYNMYPDALKYVVFDLSPVHHKQYESDRLRMISFLLVLAAHPAPKGMMKARQIYRADLQMDESAIQTIFTQYLGKLQATSWLIRETADSIDREMQVPLDNKTSRQLFESEISIPVEIREYTRGDLKADTTQIGLAKDCPQNEKSAWDTQYQQIEKKFVRYMREPQRALKASVINEFSHNTKIEDDRAHQLNENQREDITYKMLEEEQQMVSEETPQIFRLEGYKKQMQSAERAVNGEIRKRMNKRQIFAVAGVSAAAFFLGFLPLFLTNLKTVPSFLFALLLSAVGLAVLMAGGLVFLFRMRSRMRAAIHRFNDSVSAICAQVESGLVRFSSYLSHACNMMREASVLHAFDSAAMKKKRILAYHDMNIHEAADSATELFSKFMDCSGLQTQDEDPYDYDFTVMANYTYPVPYSLLTHRIEYLQGGNEIEVPADYVTSITLDRVDLYE